VLETGSYSLGGRNKYSKHEYIGVRTVQLDGACELTWEFSCPAVGGRIAK
jgi:hypothetical protein